MIDMNLGQSTDIRPQNKIATPGIALTLCIVGFQPLRWRQQRVEQMYTAQSGGEDKSLGQDRIGLTGAFC
jgi:hypothetical protein